MTTPPNQDELVAALRPLANIYAAYLNNNLDEVRPSWNRGLDYDLAYELYTGRGGKCLITLRDCQRAWLALGGQG